MLEPKGFTKIRIDNVGQDLLDSFDHLILDQYVPDARRYRRFSQFRVYWEGGEWMLEKLPHRPLVQPKSLNYSTGGVRREFESMTADPSAVMNQILTEVKLDTNIDWHLDINQYRVYGSRLSPGVSVPEGRHRDGHKFVKIVVFRRHNIEGCELSLYRTLSKTESPFYQGVVEENEAIILDDELMFHDATPVNGIGTEDDPGHRDYFSTALNPWSERHYGPEFEKWAEEN